MRQQFQLTQSAIKTLGACPKMYKIKYIDGWRERFPAEAMTDGSLWHDIRAKCALKRSRSDIVGHIANTCGERVDRAAKFVGMYEAYKYNYDEAGAVLQHQGVELTFEYPLINPDTGRASRAGVITGRLDGLLHDSEGRWWIIEYKTASQIEGNYITRLSLDLQIHLYKRYAERMLGIKITGVIYDVIKKPTIHCKQGESESEYQIRVADLILKSKTGKSSAKRKIAETPLEFSKRVFDWYAANAATAFYRDKLILSDLQIERECWMIYQEILWRRRHNIWPRRDQTCLTFYGRRCPFFSYCESGDSQLILETEFDHVDVMNPELVGGCL